MTKRTVKKRSAHMPDSKTMVDIATLNANYANLKEAMGNVLGEVRAGNAQNVEILKTLGGINKQQEFSADYQEKCDNDRDGIRRDMGIMDTRLQAAISANTNSISRMNGRTAGIALSISTIIGLLTLWVESHK